MNSAYPERHSQRRNSLYSVIVMCCCYCFFEQLNIIITFYVRLPKANHRALFFTNLYVFDGEWQQNAMHRLSLKKKRVSPFRFYSIHSTSLIFPFIRAFKAIKWQNENWNIFIVAHRWSHLISSECNIIELLARGICWLYVLDVMQFIYKTQLHTQAFNAISFIDFWGKKNWHEQKTPDNINVK